jgi:hypothetical protein
MSDERRKQPSIDELLPGEKHLSRLYGQTKEEEPPADLDAMVLMAARRAVEPAPRASRVYFLPPRKWAVPLALAAALLVSIGVVREFHKDIATPVLFAPVPSSLSVSPMSSQGVLRSKEPNEQENPSLPPEKKRPESGMAKELSTSVEKLGAPKLAPSVSEERSHARGSQAGSPYEDLSVADVEKRTAPTESVRRDTQSTSPPATPSALPEKDEKIAPAAAQALPQLAKEKSVATPESRQVAPPASEQSSVAALKNETLSPEAWMAKINKLRRAKKSIEAEASLKKFKERYPTYPVEKFLE